ncbi:MAG: patatin-like phospholipase family protein [Desulfurella sp.]|uniref:patatin-like phospholipase family protein n=1 Tax=Desulfurella sp. TaxID=1962857 RepID=UPI003D11B9BE
MALGGGSAWAIAHIGVIKIFEENGIKIHSISGTSAGSIVASLYAFGISVEKMQEIALNLHLSDIFKWKVSRMGLSSTQKIKHLIKKYIGNAKVEEALIPLYIPATDIVNLKPTLMQNVSVAEAVAASCAIPGMFTPVTINNQMFVDGSLFADVPCKILKLKKLGLVVGVELTDMNILTKKPENVFEVITKSLQGLINETRKERLKYADVIISPNIRSVGRFEFEKAHLLLEIGQNAAKKHINYIKRRLGIR